MKKLVRVVSLVSVMASSPMFAEDELSLSSILDLSVTAVSKKKESIFLSPSNSVTITGEQIKAWGSRNLKDVMKRVPGFQVISDRDEMVFASRGNVSDNNNKYLIVIDGHRLNSAENFGPGQVIENPLDMSIVKRIEIIRGPGSAVWGADALAGVISISTWDGTDIAKSGVASITRGTENTQKASLMLSKKINDESSLIAMFNYIDSDGEIIKQDRPGSGSAFPSTRNDAIPTWQDRQKPSYSIYVKGKAGDFKVNAMHLNVMTFNRQHEADQGRGDYWYSTEKNFIETQFTGYTLDWKVWHAENRAEYLPDTNVANVNNSNTGNDNRYLMWRDRQLGVSADGSNTFNDFYTTLYGAEIVSSRFGPNPNLSPWNPQDGAGASSTPGKMSAYRDTDLNFGSYLMNEFLFSNSKVVLGSRADYNRSRGKKEDNLIFNPRASYAVEFRKNESAKIMYNQGFLKSNNYIDTNKSSGEKVNSELMKQFELQWMKVINNTQLTVTAFTQELKGFVNIKGDQSGFLNSGNYKASGVELEYNQHFDNFRAWANFSYSNAKVDNFSSLLSAGDKRVGLNGKLLSYAPITANAGIEYKSGKFSIAPALRFVGSTDYRSGPLSSSTTTLDNVALHTYAKTDSLYFLDVNMAYAFTENLNLSLYVDNATNERGPTNQAIRNGTVELYGLYSEAKLTYSF